MISASVEDALSLARRWRDENSPLRFVSSLKKITASFDCSVVVATGSKIGLRVSGQRQGVAMVDLAGCVIAFGAEDMPEAEAKRLEARLVEGLSVITPDMESIWLLEVERSASE